MRTLLATALLLALTACDCKSCQEPPLVTTPEPEATETEPTSDPHAADQQHGTSASHIEGLPATVLFSGLNNPASVTVTQGRILICDTQGVHDASHGDHLHLTASGFATEFWKGEDKENGLPPAFELGALSALALADDTLIISDSGQADGEDQLVFLPSGIKDIAAGLPTGGFDKEGNFVGLSTDGTTVYVCGQGEDSRSAILAVDIATQQWSVVFELGDIANSPMASVVEDGILWVLFSDDAKAAASEDGKNDGLLVAWDLKAKAKQGQWTLPGLNDPMGLAKLPGQDTFLIVANNWHRSKVLPGTLAAVSITTDSPTAQVNTLATGLQGPTSCALTPEGDLLVTELGEAFDQSKGQVLRFANAAQAAAR